MILYDENSCIIGVDQKTIELFGYRDIAKFTKEVNDVADFFVKKDGYVCKHDTYSWIDFINYSEEDVHKALIIKKDDNATAIKVNIQISELIATSDINNSTTLYLVDIAKEADIEIPDLELACEDIENENPSKKIEIDYKKVAETTGIDKNLYDELLYDFIEEGKKELENIYIYLKNKDDKKVLKNISKLLTLCKNLNLEPFVPTLEKIEVKLTKKKYNNVQKLIDLFKQQLNTLYENISKNNKRGF